MRMRSAAGLHCCYLLWILHVGDVEDSYAAETVLLGCRQALLSFFSWGRWRLGRKSLSAAIEASIGHFHGHEEKILVHRDIALSAGADQRSQQRSLGRIGDVISSDSVKITLEQMVALEGHVGIAEGELRDHHLQLFGDFHA